MALVFGEEKSAKPKPRNIKLEMIEEPVYAHDCYKCGRIHLTDHWIPGGMPYLLLAITHKVQMRHKDRRARHA